MSKLRRVFGVGRPVSSAPDEGGAAIVEMAILLPILLLLVIGVFELGGAFKDYLTTANAVREGTRILSARGTEPTADCVALVAAVNAMSIATNLENLVEVQIFEANDDGEPVTGKINTYKYSSGDPTVCMSTSPCGSWTCTIQQPPSSRSALVGPDVSPDLIGMKIIYTHHWYSDFPPFNGFITIDEQTISRLEPEGLG